jgi:beta-lactamase regulating signal transducer with metallopeptidase domain
MESLLHDMLSNAVVVTVLAGAIAVLGRIYRHPPLIHSLCLLAILKLITPSVVPVPLPWPLPAADPPRAVSEESYPVDLGEKGEAAAPALADALEAEPKQACEAVLGASVPEAVGGQDAVERPEYTWRHPLLMRIAANWKPSILGLVLAGAIGWWSLALVRIARFHRVLSDAEWTSAVWELRARELAGRLALRRYPAVRLVPGEIPPMLWTLGIRSRLLLPRRLWETLGEAERTALLLHELAHLKRLDHWVRWMELVIAGLYWWHPVVWWLRRTLREAEEQCCDAWVIWAMPQGNKTYAGALLAALEFVSGARTVRAAAVASATVGDGHLSCIKRRLRMIMRAKTPKTLSWAGRLTVMGIAALLLPLTPTWAQKGAPESRVTLADGPERPADVSLLGEQEFPVLSENLPESAVDVVQDEQPRDDKERETAERIESHLKELIEKLGKELGPVAEEVRKSLERAVGEVHRSLQKEGMTAEDLRQALVRSQDELLRSFQQGGPVEREAREAFERARDQLNEAADQAGKEMERTREQMRDALRSRVDEARERLRSRRDEALEQARARTRSQDRSPGEGESEPDRPQAESRPRRGETPENRDTRNELEAARKEIRDLQQRLQQANRRLEALQRRELRRPESSRRAPERPSVTPRPPAPPESPRPDATPAPPVPPVPPVAPAAPAPSNAPRRARPPAPPRTPEAGPRDSSERRLRDLEEKMNQLLRELESLRREKAVRT